MSRDRYNYPSKTTVTASAEPFEHTDDDDDRVALRGLQFEHVVKSRLNNRTKS